jgi:hypothetical protein
MFPATVIVIPNGVATLMYCMILANSGTTGFVRNQSTFFLDQPFFSIMFGFCSIAILGPD